MQPEVPDAHVTGGRYFWLLRQPWSLLLRENLHLFSTKKNNRMVLEVFGSFVMLLWSCFVNSELQNF